MLTRILLWYLGTWADSQFIYIGDELLFISVFHIICLCANNIPRAFVWDGNNLNFSRSFIFKLLVLLAKVYSKQADAEFHRALHPCYDLFLGARFHRYKIMSCTASQSSMLTNTQPKTICWIRVTGSGLCALHNK